MLIKDDKILSKGLGRSYIKWFVWCNLHDSQSAFKFLWRLHYHTICSYQVHKSCTYRLFSIQELKLNDLRTSCTSSKSRKKRKKEESMWNFGLKEEKNVELYGTFRLLHFFFSNHISDFFTFHKKLLIKKTPDLSSFH